MTNREELPREVREGLDAVSRATASLVAAAAEADADTMLDALSRRAEAIASLESPLRALGDRLDSASSRILAEEKHRLDREARSALERVGALAGRIRGALDALGRDTNAVRGYTASPLPATTLDRAG